MKDLAEELVKDTINLLIKDFSMFGINISFSGNFNSAYDEIMKQLVPQMDFFLNNHHESLLAILYKIEVSENKIKKMHDQNPYIKYSKLLAHLILEREWQKALTRKYYNDKEKSFDMKYFEKQFIPQLKN